MEKSFKPAIAEGIASFIFVCVAAGVICANAMTQNAIGWVGIALANAFAFTALVAFTSHISGGHVNPAVTIGNLFSGRIDFPKATFYIIAQLVGAILAGFVTRTIFPANVWQTVSLGAPILNNPVTTGGAIFIEFLFTCFFVMVAIGCTADDRAPKNLAPLAMGFALGFATLVIGPLTGAGLNPARAFGSAIGSGNWTNQVPYWIGPVLGGICAPILYRICGGQITKMVSSPWADFESTPTAPEPKVTVKSVNR